MIFLFSLKDCKSPRDYYRCSMPTEEFGLLHHNGSSSWGSAALFMPEQIQSWAFPLRLSRAFTIHLERGNLRTMPEKRVDDRPSVSGKMLDEANRILREYLVRLGLKQSSKRDTILRTFLATRDHLSTEEPHGLVKKSDSTIGYTTVYRTLKLFAQCGLASVVEFQDSVARYEHSLNRRNHHHMVCTVCGDSVEFFSPEVEKVEHRIGKKFHYATANQIRI